MEWGQQCSWVETETETIVGESRGDPATRRKVPGVPGVIHEEGELRIHSFRDISGQEAPIEMKTVV